MAYATGRAKNEVRPRLRANIAFLAKHFDILALQETNLGAEDRSYFRQLLPNHLLFHNSLDERTAGTLIALPRQLEDEFDITGHTLVRGYVQQVKLIPKGEWGHSHSHDVVNCYIPANRLTRDTETITAKRDRVLRVIRHAAEQMCRPGVRYLVGDFNFVEKLPDSGSGSTHYQVTTAFRDSFAQILTAGRMEEIPQDEFTFLRQVDSGGELRTDCARLDRIYAGAPEAVFALWGPTSRIVRAPYLPHQRKGKEVSDHFPVGLSWFTVVKPSTKGTRIPRYILATEEFRSSFWRLWQYRQHSMHSHTADARLAVFLETIRDAVGEARGHLQSETVNTLKQIRLQKHLLHAMQDGRHREVDSLLAQLPALKGSVKYDVATNTYNSGVVSESLSTLYVENADTCFESSPSLPPGRGGDVAFDLTGGGAGAAGLYYRASDLPTGPDVTPPLPLSQQRKQPSSWSKHTRMTKRLGLTLPSSRKSLNSLLDPVTGTHTGDKTRMAEIAKEFWTDMWRSRGRNDRLISSYLRDYAPVQEELHVPQITTELMTRIIATSNSSSAGVDGIPFMAFRVLIEAAAPLLAEFADGLATGAFPPPADFNLCLLVLLPKKNTGYIRHTRPISIPTAVNRLVSRAFCDIVTEAVTPHLHPSQRAGVPGKRITDNILDANEWLSTRVGQSAYLLLVDFVKAFDSVKHSFIHAILRAWRLPAYHRRLFRTLLHQVEATPVWGLGKHNIRIPVERGIKQGGPSSPLIFVLLMDPLLRQLAAILSTSSGYMDDVLGGDETREAIARAAPIFSAFGAASGLVINPAKTIIITAKPENEEPIPGWTGVKFTSKGKYLGLVIGPGASVQENFAGPIDKLEQRVQAYTQVRQAMSVHRRIIVANIFLVSVLSYICQFYIIPDHLLPRIEAALKRWIIPLGQSGFKLSAATRPTRCLGLLQPLLDVKTYNLGLLGKEWMRVKGRGIHASTRSTRILRHIRSALQTFTNVGASGRYFEGQLVPPVTSAGFRTGLHQSTCARLDRQKALAQSLWVKDLTSVAQAINHYKSLPSKGDPATRSTYFLFIHNALPLKGRALSCVTNSTKEDRQLWRVCPSQTPLQYRCGLCGAAFEDRDHAFLQCPATMLARRMLAHPGSFNLSWLPNAPPETFFLQSRPLTPGQVATVLCLIHAIRLTLMRQLAYGRHPTERHSAGVIARLFEEAICDNGAAWRDAILTNGSPPPPPQAPPQSTPPYSASSDSDDSLPTGPGDRTWEVLAFLARRRKRTRRRQPPGRRRRRRRARRQEFEVQVHWAIDGSTTWEPYSILTPCPALEALFHDLPP